MELRDGKAQVDVTGDEMPHCVYDASLAEVWDADNADGYRDDKGCLVGLPLRKVRRSSLLE
jgi:hypothetical protein